VEKLCQSMKNFEVLILNFNENINQDVLPMVLELPNLQTLFVNDVDVTSSVVCNTYAGKLKLLSLNRLSEFTEEDHDKLAANMPSLKQFVLYTFVPKAVMDRHPQIEYLGDPTKVSFSFV